MPKSKYLGRLTFRKLRKKSTTLSLEREQRKTCDLTKETLEIEEIVNKVNYSNRTWIYKPTQSNEDTDLSHDKPSPTEGSSEQSSNCTWVHKDGTTSLNIPKTPLYSLTEAEIITLQKLAVICLRSVNFNCNIIIPREYPNQNSAGKPGHYSRWNHIRKLSGSKSPDSKELGNRVFGVPLGSLVRNQNKENFPVLQPNGALEVSADGRQPSPSGQSRSPDHKKMVAARRRTGADAINPNEGENFAKLKNYLLVEEEHFEALSSASLLSSSYGDLVTSSTTTGFRKLSQMALDSPNNEFRARGPSFSSIYSILARSATSLVDALTLSSETSEQQNDVISNNKNSSAESESAKYSVPTEPCVPPFVKSCIEFIRNHNGLHTVGIFRVAGSKKRIKSLREEFDTYGEIDWINQSNAATVHDVAALMKCFLRELPDGLLSKELYHPLIATTKLDDHKLQLKCLKYLLCLLPRANRDTLYYIASFLSEIHQATTAEQGPNASPEMSGSKMNAANLATVFGPTLLKPPSSKTASNSDITVEKMEYIEDYTPIVYITQTLILCHQELFQLDGTTTSKVLQIIQETNADATDFIIYQRYGKLTDECTIATPKLSTERKPSGDPTRVSIKRSHHTPRSLSCCRHSIKQARERFFEEPAYTATRTQPTTPLIGVPNSEKEHKKSEPMTMPSSGNNMDPTEQNEGVSKPEVGTYTRKFRSNRSVGMAKN